MQRPRAPKTPEPSRQATTPPKMIDQTEEIETRIAIVAGTAAATVIVTAIETTAAGGIVAN